MTANAESKMRPSRDYLRNLRNREYGGDAKKAREEERAVLAKERKEAREKNAEVDVGKAEEYWKNTVVASKAKAPPMAKMTPNAEPKEKAAPIAKPSRDYLCLQNRTSSKQ